MQNKLIKCVQSVSLCEWAVCRSDVSMFSCVTTQQRDLLCESMMNSLFEFDICNSDEDEFIKVLKKKW